ncbi:MAG TPA: tetratricopeptide repeat protein [Elusimicrobiota bacterium]|nr:tetratricopeptide repeat protein [Elusimicrobiota bacterium]
MEIDLLNHRPENILTAGRVTAGLEAIVLAALVALANGTARADMPPDLADGITAFEQQRWTEAMDDFLAVLRQNPGDRQVHAYVTLVARELELQRRANLERERLQILNDASQRLSEFKSNQTAMRNALFDAEQSGTREQADKWRAQCEEARMQRQLGHLLPANDLILQILIQDPSNMEAQRELSELQSSLRRELDSPENLSILERFVYEGFYAYGQADYDAAYTAWEKARAVIRQTGAAGQELQTIESLRFERFEKVAQGHVEEKQRAAQLQAAFERAAALYKAGHYTDALEAFRQLAIQEPEYPQLGFYLVQAEAAAEKDRARRLGEAKREQMAKLMDKGVTALEQEKYESAERAFEEVLSIDPSHTQARSYLAMAKTESSRLHDPKAAQMHYEAGLIAYASGKLDEAVREWRVAARMDPQNEKVSVALNKVQRELALSNQTSDFPDER